MSLPKIRDFRGISKKGCDNFGNFSFGIKDDSIFPESNTELDRLRGMDVTICTTSRSKEELLFYLDPIKYFTIKDFQNGTMYYHWDRQRFYRLQREGWVEKIHKGNGRLGDHNKYKVSMRGKRLINKIYKILIGQEDMPIDAKRSKIGKRSTYVDKVYANAITKFNKDKL